jgi:putative hydrolase of the HAD superfamily
VISRAFPTLIFDLFGTLVFDKFSSVKYPLFLNRLASQLGLEPEEFAFHWQASYLERTKGKYTTLQDNLRWVGERLGRSLTPSGIEAAVLLLEDITRQALQPRVHVLETLRLFRQEGIRTGLISDCGPAVPRVWGRNPLAEFFHATAFSCREGLKKPDPEFYRVLLWRLDCRAEECLYVGDGHSGELEGAEALGMKAVLVWSAIDPEEPERLVLKDWKGTVVKSPAEIPWLLGI